MTSRLTVTIVTDMTISKATVTDSPIAALDMSATVTASLTDEG